MKIELSEIERDILVNNVLKNSFILREIIENAIVLNGKYLIDLNIDTADEIRDLCSEQLQIEGFDEEYNLNRKGEVLDKLIDIFYIQS